MTILQVNPNTYDVFVGIGWNNWSRFERQGKKINLVKGSPMSKENYSVVCRAIYKMQ